MTQSQKIPVEKVTKPIQLLAAWLTGLTLINGMFLAAANTINTPVWVAGTLVVASIINVPIFLAAIFLLQTKFRPEMQEDSFYSKYLESKSGMVRLPVSSNQLSKLKEEIFISNTETLEIVSALQAEVKRLAGSVNIMGINEQIVSNGLEQKIKTVTDASAWNQYEIRINKFLKDFDKFKMALAKNNIPVHGIIGNDTMKLNDPPEILIGSGFSLEHIRQFLNAIKHLPIALIGFAEADTEEENYHKEILLGAYNSHQGLSVENAVELANQENIDVEVFYSALYH